ncbi:MAG: hypothetical protein ACRDPK_05885 [Carbonactinosporaceae bacterium]
MTKHTYEIRYRGTAAASSLTEQVEADRFSDRANFVDFEVCEQEDLDMWRTILRIRHDDVLQIKEHT